MGHLSLRHLGGIGRILKMLGNSLGNMTIDTCNVALSNTHLLFCAEHSSGHRGNNENLPMNNFSSLILAEHTRLPLTFCFGVVWEMREGKYYTCKVDQFLGHHIK